MNEWKECDFENYPEYCRGCSMYTESKLDNLDCEVIEKINSSHIDKCPCADCLIKMKCIHACDEYRFTPSKPKPIKRKKPFT